MHFHCSRIDNTTQQRRFPSDRLRIKPFLASFRQASKPAPRVVFCTMSNASPLQKLCQCNVDLRIDFDRIGTSFDIVNVYYWCVLLSCVSLDDRTTAVAMFSNLKAQSFHDAALEKSRQLGECSRLDECSVSSGCPVLRLDFRSHLNICSIPVPAFQHVRQLSLQRIFSLS